MEDRVTETQVMVIGGGIVGAAIARELTKYRVDVSLIEKESGVGWGITKGSQGLVHGGVSYSLSRIVKWWDKSKDLKTHLGPPLHLKEKLNRQGWRKFVELAPILGAKVRQCGRVVVAENEADLAALEIMKGVAEANGFKGAVMLDRKELLKKEPALDSKFIGGLYDPNELSIFPQEWATAFAENARDNGAHILLNTAVQGIEDRKGYYLVKTSNGPIKAQFVINAAGLFSDEIAAMVGKVDWSFTIWKHQMLIIENKNYINHIVCEVYKPRQPRQLILTAEGNILVMGTMEEGTSKYDFSTTREGLDLVGTYPQFYIPDISLKKDMVSSFVGYMHFNTRNPDDYLIEWPRERFLNLIVCPPGLGGSVPLAQEVVKMLAGKGLVLEENRGFNPYRRRGPRFIELSTEEKNEKVKQNPEYGHIVCRCEKVSEQEIREAIRRGATTLDQVKFETRAGMGRCQGGFCTSRVLKLMSEELGISPLEITKRGGNSYILKHETKGLRVAA